ncbi:hypothetical protein X917_gp09 [Pseudomonas phage PPpW-4]|uniref:Uncharacterized protein n=1 Tax=Pseudomonas phage PPpW-4 TaxID=1279083 RepID=V5YSX8_9CAUD|nr:hypothetical protein X917_gp09 [Pseudomonas phage PPpW-4]BAO20675.1 hypothetical protein [Pseudomonas phage PPpW-4]
MKARARSIKFKVEGPVQREPRRTAIGTRYEVVGGGIKEHAWGLGMGPCGRYVHSLEVSVTPELLTISQTSYPSEFSADDRKVEHFVYKMSDVVGRVRIEAL